jgi:hypothetical protein
MHPLARARPHATAAPNEWLTPPRCSSALQNRFTVGLDTPHIGRLPMRPPRAFNGGVFATADVAIAEDRGRTPRTDDATGYDAKAVYGQYKGFCDDPSLCPSILTTHRWSSRHGRVPRFLRDFGRKAPLVFRHTSIDADQVTILGVLHYSPNWTRCASVSGAPRSTRSTI